MWEEDEVLSSFHLQRFLNSVVVNVPYGGGGNLWPDHLFHFGRPRRGAVDGPCGFDTGKDT